MEITYRKGLPTKKFLRELISSFDAKMRLHINDWYGNGYGRDFLLWQDSYTQSKMEEFMVHATSLGIKFGEYEPYISPRVGHLCF